MLDPTNPYSAAKAGAEMMCKAYLTRCARGCCLSPLAALRSAARPPGLQVPLTSSSYTLC